MEDPARRERDVRGVRGEHVVPASLRVPCGLERDPLQAVSPRGKLDPLADPEAGPVRRHPGKYDASEGDQREEPAPQVRSGFEQGAVRALHPPDQRRQLCDERAVQLLRHERGQDARGLPRSWVRPGDVQVSQVQVRVRSAAVHSRTHPADAGPFLLHLQALRGGQEGIYGPF